MLYQPKEMLAGHIKVFGGPHVARGPDVAQACSKGTFATLQNNKTILKSVFRTIQ